jgi:hypothetical protein
VEEKEEAAGGGEEKPPVEKPISRPHQASGRQLEDLLAIRSSLREGFHRYSVDHVGVAPRCCIYS